MKPANILNIETLTEDWCDKDLVLLHACFQLLTDCIEKENLFNGHVDWTHDEEHKNAKIEIEELYNWWKIRIEKDQSSDVDPIWSKHQFNEDTSMLIRLIKIRGFLWT